VRSAHPSPVRLAWQRRVDSLLRTWTSFRRVRSGMVGLGILVFFVVIALSAPLLADRSGLDLTTAPGKPLESPSGRFWLGTDQNGRSILTLLMYGARISLFVGVLATAISVVLGTAVGLASGHFRGFAGSALFRVTEWFLVIPFLPLAIVLASLLGPSLFNTALVIGVTGWASTAALIRSQTLTIETRPYLERARALGGGHWHQMTRQILPNVLPMVLANTTLTIAVSILTETTLSFLGLGGSNTISWGYILEQAFQLGSATNGLWWFFIPPGLCVIATVLAFTLVGRALEDVLNPLRSGR
jgi:peptide/nickel transport system permease protein